MARLRFITKLKLAAIGAAVAANTAAALYGAYHIDKSARVAWGEARGEPGGGMQAVLNVMVNRKRDPRFPSTLSGVATQPCQFSAFNDADPNRRKLEAVGEENRHYKKAFVLAALAQINLLPDITSGATYYHTTDMPRPAYLADAEVSAVIGNHVFYRNAD